VKLSILHHQEEKEIMEKLFHIKIHVKKTKINTIFYSTSQDNILAMDIVRNLGLEVENHPRPYSLGWVNKDAEIKVAK
jgi:hypothetical protein